MKGKPARRKELLQSALGAGFVALVGILLWNASWGDAWINASYDALYTFGTHPVTNKVVLIQMDNEAYNQFGQTRRQPWDRKLHIPLLNRLAGDGAALVVFDVFFEVPRDPEVDRALADAMQRNQKVALMAKQSRIVHRPFVGARPILPTEPFLSACGGTNWGVAWLTPDLDDIVRKHWPFPSPGPYPSLPQTAAQLCGATLDETARERWIRYYGHPAQWTELSYAFALSQPTNFFRDCIVFIGSAPANSRPDGEEDEFSTPYTRLTGESAGGVEILITSFLNLINRDWMERPSAAAEMALLIGFGCVLGGVTCRLRFLKGMALAAGIGIAISVAAILISYYTRYWFPWLIPVGAQVPCALIWAAAIRVRRPQELTKTVVLAPAPHPGAPPGEALLEIPGYELYITPFGEGAYGKVWLARKPGGPWKALKVVYLAKFDQNTDPYDREFNGVSRYQRVSGGHPGLLRVEFVSEKRPDYFYYVMELGDPVELGWEADPSRYKPRDLVNMRAHLHGRRLPVRECLDIGLSLTNALQFLHEQGLTHRDIKPQNVIFVNGLPRLADVGLIAEIRPPDQERTAVGTPGYMPPAPERPGTPQADIYSLGMVLYVLSTGRAAAHFPELSSTLLGTEPAEFMPLNDLILKACHPDPAQRFQSAAEMHQAMKRVGDLLATSSAAASPSNRIKPDGTFFCA